MEIINRYRPILKNEVPVFQRPMINLFKDYNIYVFGYGSLMYEHGWQYRGMLDPPCEKELIECCLEGFERGPFGVYGDNLYYGVIRNATRECNGVLARIRTIGDWIALMRTECIAGIYRLANYRVVDVTNDIIDVCGQLESPYKVHCVCNRPGNREKMLYGYPVRHYFGEVWERVHHHRSEAFFDKFMETGGFTSGASVSSYLYRMRRKKEK